MTDGIPEHQRRRFDPARAARLDDPARFAYLAPDAVVAFVDAPHDALVVDFGTGTGTYAIEFAQRRPDCTVVGIDRQPEMLEMLRAKPAGSRVRAGGPELLDELAGKIERVFAINVLHELEDEHLRALFAALAPAGEATFIDWNADVERPAGPPAESLYGPAQATAYLAGLGFTVTRSATFPYQYALAGRLAR
jgi:SAM-dependent methyltransferase